MPPLPLSIDFPVRLNLLRSAIHDDGWLFARRTLLVLIWFGLATLTHIPVPQTAPGITGIDKVIHWIAYFPLGLLLPTSRIPGLRRGILCFGGIAAYGVLDELLQIPVGRTASVGDWLADVAGAGAGWWCNRCLHPETGKSAKAEYQSPVKSDET